MQIISIAVKISDIDYCLTIGRRTCGAGREDKSRRVTFEEADVRKQRKRQKNQLERVKRRGFLLSFEAVHRQRTYRGAFARMNIAAISVKAGQSPPRERNFQSRRTF